MSVTEQSIIPRLQQVLIEYLENNEFARIRVQQKKSLLTSMIKKFSEEIAGLEDFKNQIYKGDFFASAKGSVMFDPTTVNTKIIDLTKQRIEYEHLLENVNSVHVVDGFTVFKRPTSPVLSISLVSGSVVGLFFVGLLIAFKAVQKIMSLEEDAIK